MGMTIEPVEVDFDLAELLDVVESLLDYSRAHTTDQAEGENEVYDRARRVWKRHRGDPDK